MVTARFDSLGGGGEDHVQIVGSPYADNTSVGSYNPGGATRYPFEFENLDFLRIQGDRSLPLDGVTYDRIVNAVNVPALLEGDRPAP